MHNYNTKTCQYNLPMEQFSEGRISENSSITTNANTIEFYSSERKTDISQILNKIAGS